MKRILSFTLALILLMSLAACGGNSAESSSQTPAPGKTDPVEASTQTPAPGKTDPVEASTQAPADSNADQTEASTKAPETTAEASTEEPVIRKDLSVDDIGMIYVPSSKGYRSSAVILISNPSSGITYQNLNLTVSFFDEKDNLMESVSCWPKAAVRPGEQVPFRVDCFSPYELKAARAEVRVDSYRALDKKDLERTIETKTISLVDDGTVFELTKLEFTKKTTGKLRIDYTVENKNTEKEKCYVFFLFKKDGKIVYGQERLMFIDGSASEDSYFYADYNDYNDFPDYDEVVTVLIKGH